MKKIFCYPAIAFALLVTSCYDGFSQSKKMIKEERPVGEFHSLVVSGLAEVILRHGPLQPANVEVSGMPAEDVIVSTENKVLTIGTNGQHNGESVKVYINCRALESIKVTDAAKLVSHHMIKTNKLSISVIDAGTATVEVDVDDLQIALQNAGDLTISGKAKKQNVKEVGEQGTLDTEGLESGN